MAGLHQVCPDHLYTPPVCTNFGIAEEFVAAGDFLTYKFPVWSWYVLDTVLPAFPDILITSH